LLPSLLEEASRLPDEVVKAGIVAVDELTSARHGGLGVLHREESCVVPVGGSRAILGHKREPGRRGAGRAIVGSAVDDALRVIALQRARGGRRRCKRLLRAARKDLLDALVDPLLGAT
jgi:hypothetical protein